MIARALDTKDVVQLREELSGYHDGEQLAAAFAASFGSYTDWDELRSHSITPSMILWLLEADPLRFSELAVSSLQDPSLAIREAAAFAIGWCQGDALLRRARHVLGSEGGDAQSALIDLIDEMTK